MPGTALAVNASRELAAAVRVRKEEVFIIVVNLLRAFIVLVVVVCSVLRYGWMSGPHFVKPAPNRGRDSNSRRA